MPPFNSASAMPLTAVESLKKQRFGFLVRTRDAVCLLNGSLNTCNGLERAKVFLSEKGLTKETYTKPNVFRLN